MYYVFQIGNSSVNIGSLAKHMQPDLLVSDCVDCKLTIVNITSARNSAEACYLTRKKLKLQPNTYLPLIAWMSNELSDSMREKITMEKENR